MKQSPQDLWMMNPAIGVPASCFLQKPGVEAKGTDSPNAESVEKSSRASGDAKSHPDTPSAKGAFADGIFADKAGAIHIDAKIELVGITMALITASGSVTVAGELKSLGNVETKYEADVNPLRCGLDLEAELRKHLELTGGGELNKKSQSIGIGLKFDKSEAGSTELKFKFLDRKKEGEESTVQFAKLEWNKSIPLKLADFSLGGCRVEGNVVLTLALEFAPNWAEIRKRIVSWLAVDAVEDVAVDETAEVAVEVVGEETVEAVIVVASGPLLVVGGAVVVGMVLYEAVIGIEADDDECIAICRDAAQQLRDYASSYGSTMRGKPGGNMHGSRDAAGQLKAMMKAKAGLTLAQAVQIAIKSGANFEDIAYRTLLPIMRQNAEEARDKKEYGVERLFTRGTFDDALEKYLPENGHYPGVSG